MDSVPCSLGEEIMLLDTPAIGQNYCVDKDMVSMSIFDYVRVQNAVALPGSAPVLTASATFAKAMHYSSQTKEHIVEVRKKYCFFHRFGIHCVPLTPNKVVNGSRYMLLQVTRLPVDSASK